MKTTLTVRIAALTVSALFLGAGGARAEFTLLHTFTGTGSDGSKPQWGSLTLSADGATLYGLTQYGGTSDDGTIFSIGATGSGYTTLHSFIGSDGQYPYNSLTLAGSTLYGTTQQGGAGGCGEVFSIGTGGGPLTTVWGFTGSYCAQYAYSTPLLVGSTLYGMTGGGGSNGWGTIFSVSTNGGSPTYLYRKFTSSGSDGGHPNGSLTLSADGTTLYAMTYLGGTYGNGRVISEPLAGGAPTTLYSFTSTNGSSPNGSLTRFGSTLFGMTMGGGTNGNGMIFRIDTSGIGFTNLYSFGQIVFDPELGPTNSDGANPYGDLTLSADGKKLYGMTSAGGTSGDGTVFALDVIPEPTVIGFLALLGFGALGWRRLRGWRRA